MAFRRNYEVIAADPDARRRRLAADSGIVRVYAQLPAGTCHMAPQPVTPEVRASGNPGCASKQPAFPPAARHFMLTSYEVRTERATVATHMKHVFTAVFERDGEWHIAYCPEIPGANGQGRTQNEARDSLRGAIELILEDRLEDGLRGLPEDAIRETVILE